MDNSQNTHTCSTSCSVSGCCGGNGSVWLGVIFVLLGGYFFGKEVGWFAVDFPFWQSVVVLVGVYFLVKGLRK